MARVECENCRRTGDVAKEILCSYIGFTSIFIMPLFINKFLPSEIQETAYLIYSLSIPLVHCANFCIRNKTFKQIAFGHILSIPVAIALVITGR